jgi:heptosyltransferase-2
MKNNIVTQKRVLIIKAGRVGDTVWGTTVIGPIMAYLGEHTRFDIIVAQGMGALFKHDSRFETIFEINHRNIPFIMSPTKLSVVCKSLQHPYDLVVNLETSSHFSSVMHFVRATQKIEASTLPPQEYKPDRRNMVHYISNILAQGVPVEFCQLAATSLKVPEYVDVAALVGNDREYLCLHPGNSLLARGKPALRSWPESHWCDLIKLISQRVPDIQIVLIGEKSERALSERITTSFPGVINLAGRTGLPQLMAVLAHAQALVTTDTGPAHVAAALTTPVIAVFGPSEAQGTGPLSSAEGWSVAVTKNIECSPCVNTVRAKTCVDNICMQAISASEIMNVLEDALQKRSRTPVVELG